MSSRRGEQCQRGLATGDLAGLVDMRMMVDVSLLQVLWPTLKESRGRVILIADGKALYQVETGTIFHR